jgi:hypothetical protein
MIRCETLKLEHVVGEMSKQAVVQGDFHVPKPKPGIEKIISVDKTVKITKEEVIKNKVIIEGYLNLQIVYVADAPGQPVHHTHARLGHQRKNTHIPVSQIFLLTQNTILLH